MDLLEFFRQIVHQDPQAPTRWGVREWLDMIDGLPVAERNHYLYGNRVEFRDGIQFPIPSRRFRNARIEVCSLFGGYKVSYLSEAEDLGAVETRKDVPAGDLVGVIDKLVTDYLEPVPRDQTRGAKLWKNTVDFINRQDPTALERWGAHSFREAQNPDDEDDRASDWTGYDWDDRGVVTFFVPGPRSVIIRVEVNPYANYGSEYNIAVMVSARTQAALDRWDLSIPIDELLDPATVHPAAYADDYNDGAIHVDGVQPPDIVRTIDAVLAGIWAHFPRPGTKRRQGKN